MEEAYILIILVNVCGKLKFLIDMQAQVQFLLGELEFETKDKR